MQAGKLRHRMTLQKQEYIRDEYGESTGEWVDQGIEAVSAAGISGRQYLAADAEQASTTSRVTMRYRDDFTNPGEWRLVDGQTVYTIKAVLPDNKRTSLTLMCESGVLQ